MPAYSPKEICRLFKRHMAEGDVEAVLTLYDPDAVFLNRAGEVITGQEGLRRELAPLVAMKSNFDYDIKQVVETGDIALMHTKWNVTGAEPITAYAIEVARRQPDGTWRWLIGDPYTVDKNINATRKGG